jgi:protein-tyrosine phosphatase
MVGNSNSSFLEETYSLIKSAAFFHASIAYNQWKYGAAFNFTPIIQTSSLFRVERDEAGRITSIEDGKKIPVALGSIPRRSEHFARLQIFYNVSPEHGLGIFSLNRDFERSWAGFSNLVKDNEKIKLFTYPTTDFTIPSLETIQEVVKKLENRDNLTISLAYVHCKAGRSRSALCIAAYLLSVCYKAHETVTIDEVVDYVARLRPLIDLNEKHKEALRVFCSSL